MTEAEWGSAPIPDLLAAVRGLSPRKRRLLAAAFCRLLEYHRDPLSSFPGALDAIERFADTGRTKAALRRVRAAVRTRRRELAQASPLVNARIDQALILLESAASENEDRVIRTVPVFLLVHMLGELGESGSEARARRKQFLAYQEITGPVGIEFAPEWRTRSAVGIALAIAVSGDFGAMPILADALEEAGCNNQLILGHCRGSETHSRGCWVVDLTLGNL